MKGSKRKQKKKFNPMLFLYRQSMGASRSYRGQCTEIIIPLGAKTF